MASEFFNDDEFGQIEIRYNARSTKYILRCVRGKIVLTLPRKRDREPGILFFNENRDYCRKALQSPKNLYVTDVFNENTEWESLTFKLKIESSDFPKFRYKLENGILHFYYPKTVNILSENSQSIVKKLLVQALRDEANVFLPRRLKMWADKFGFSYNSCVIRDNTSRWGSCSSKRNINLSLYLMKLPLELIDYVLLHELCHLKEMNHSSQFWELLSSLLGKDAKKVREQLKLYPTSI